jgi:hypothetical protein
MDSFKKRIKLLAVTLLAAAAVPASAQLSVTANGPYYATPSWGQKLTTNRFVILANWNSEAVLDRETGLVWERSPDTTLRDWSLAQFHCNSRSVGGRMGWRLPGIQELASLMDPTVSGQRLPAGHPFVNVQFAYWSTTSRDIVVTTPIPGAWFARFSDGDIFVIGKSNQVYVWCVRGGPGSDVQ